jgi:C1A family cysteine protease
MAKKSPKKKTDHPQTKHKEPAAASDHALKELEPLKRRIARFGWVRDHLDHRDELYSVPFEMLSSLPRAVDLRSKCPPVYDQGQIGSCTANAIAGAIQFDRMKSGETPNFVPSRLFIYYNERVIEHTVATDSGAQIRDGIKSISTLGVCPETEWPYVATPAPSEGGAFPHGSPPATKPPAAAYNDAKNYKVVSYHKLVQNLGQMKGCLAQGFPFVFGITVYDSIYDAHGNPKTVFPLPSHSDSPIGGHAIMAVGYDDAKLMFTFRNSWGTAVGDAGYFYIPYSYLTDSQLASDFWIIRAVAH